MLGMSKSIISNLHSLPAFPPNSCTLSHTGPRLTSLLSDKALLFPAVQGLSVFWILFLSSFSLSLVVYYELSFLYA